MDSSFIEAARMAKDDSQVKMSSEKNGGMRSTGSTECKDVPVMVFCEQIYAAIEELTNVQYKEVELVCNPFILGIINSQTRVIKFLSDNMDINLLLNLQLETVPPIHRPTQSVLLVLALTLQNPFN